MYPLGITFSFDLYQYSERHCKQSTYLLYSLTSQIVRRPGAPLYVINAFIKHINGLMVPIKDDWYELIDRTVQYNNAEYPYDKFCLTTETVNRPWNIKFNDVIKMFCVYMDEKVATSCIRIFGWNSSMILIHKTI